MPPWRAQPAGPAPSGQPAASDLGWPAALLAIGFAAALCIPYRPYILALHAAERVSPRTLLLLTVGLAITALVIYPAYGSDLFVYLDYERLWVAYGANPLLAFANLHPEDWAFRYVWIPEQPSPYGPLWPIVTWPIASLAGDGLWGWIVGYKLLALLGYVVCCWLVWHSAAPLQRRRALVLFAWSPLVLFEALGKAHNDSLMAVSALAAVWLVRRSAASAGRSAPTVSRPTASVSTSAPSVGRLAASVRRSAASVRRSAPSVSRSSAAPAFAMLAATAGTLVKASGVAANLGVALTLVRARAWRQLAIAAVISAVVTIALYAPFWVGPQTLAPLLFQTNRVVWSLGALLISSLGWLLPHIDLVARVITFGAWVVVCGLVWRYGHSPASDYAWLLVGTLLLLTTAFFAHYLVPVVGLAAIASSQRLERVVLALSIGSLAAYAVELLGIALPPGWIGSPGYQALGSLLILVPPATVAALGFRGTPRARADSLLKDRAPSTPV